jgi:hypothetical protein
MRNRHSSRWWLLAAIVFLGLAGLLLRACGDAPEIAPRPPPELPRAMRPAESNRMTARQVLPARSPQAQHHRDPVLSALSAPDAGIAVVLEANALRYSPVGQLLLNCFAALEKDGGGPSTLEAVRAQGLDPLRDLDRVAFADENVVLSGDFSRVKWDAMVGSAEPYGEAGQLHSMGPQASGAEGPVLATWGTQLVMVSPSRAVAIASLDRIEGRSPTAQLLSDNQAYGDMYGVLSGTALGSLLGPPGSPLAVQLGSAASSVEFHLDATHDLGLVATASGDDPAKLQDLGKAFGGAIALSRSEAVLRGDAVTAELLESAQVAPSGATINLEMAIPLEVLRKLLASCGRTPGVDAGP